MAGNQGPSQEDQLLAQAQAQAKANQAAKDQAAATQAAADQSAAVKATATNNSAAAADSSLSADQIQKKKANLLSTGLNQGSLLQ